MRDLRKISRHPKKGGNVLRNPLIGLLFALLPALSLADPSPPSIPDTPAGHALKEWLDAFNSGDRETFETFAKAHGS